MVKPADGRGEGEPAEQRTDPRPLGYLLRQGSAAHRLRMERALVDIDVTPPQMLVMTLLATHAEPSSADIARRAALTPPTVSVIVANLERRGVLERRPDPTHGRIRHLVLTEAGRALLAACRVRAAVVERELAADLSPADLATIRRWLIGVGA